MAARYAREVALGLGVAILLYAAATAAIPDGTPLWAAVAVIQSALLAAAGICVLATRARPGERLALGAPRLGHLALAVGGVVALHMLLRGAEPFLAALFEHLTPDAMRRMRLFEEDIRAAMSTHPVLTLVAVTMLPALCEEALFRGWFLAPRARAAGALITSSVLFAVIHGLVPRIAVTLVLGLFFGLAVLSARSLWVGVAAHAVNNLLALVLPPPGFADLYGGLFALPVLVLIVRMLVRSARASDAAAR